MRTISRLLNRFSVLRAQEDSANHTTGSIAIGQQAESLAKDYLIAQGLYFVERNFSCKQGEIDVIMRSGEQLIFVEVRYRKHASFGSGAASITRTKRQKLVKAVAAYLLKNGRSSASTSFRIDVIEVSPVTIQKNIHANGDSESFRDSHIRWIKNAITQT